MVINETTSSIFLAPDAWKWLRKASITQREYAEILLLQIAGIRDKCIRVQFNEQVLRCSSAQTPCIGLTCTTSTSQILLWLGISGIEQPPTVINTTIDQSRLTPWSVSATDGDLIDSYAAMIDRRDLLLQQYHSENKELSNRVVKLSRCAYENANLRQKLARLQEDLKQCEQEVIQTREKMALAEQSSYMEKEKAINLSRKIQRMGFIRRIMFILGFDK